MLSVLLYENFFRVYTKSYFIDILDEIYERGGEGGGKGEIIYTRKEQRVLK
jgi:hypothetical protein